MTKRVNAGAQTHSGATTQPVGSLFLKVHPASSAAASLPARLRLASRAPEVLVQPLSYSPRSPRSPGLTARAAVSLWPLVKPLRADSPDQVDWAALGGLTGRLHRHPCPDDAPPSGLVHRWSRVRRGLVEVRAPDVVQRAAAALPDPRVPRPSCLVHGDLHLGQVARTADGWRLLDLDDLGAGDPAEDLGRVAGAWASGRLDESSWHSFLAAYRQADGPAVPHDCDPWRTLDVPARRSVLIAVYGLLRDQMHAGLDDELTALTDHLIEVCATMPG